VLVSYDALYSRDCEICDNLESKGFILNKRFICHHCESRKFIYLSKINHDDGNVTQKLDFGFPKVNETPESLVHHWNCLGGKKYEYTLLTG
jgi:hypothetical protein